MGHWYTAEGQAMHTVTGANGKTRDTTLRDAKKLNLIESVTSQLNVFAKPGLENWKANRLISTCGAYRREEGEPYDEYKKRINQAIAIEQDKVMDFGTLIHDRLERALSGEMLPQESVLTPEGDTHLVSTFVQPVLEMFNDNKWQVAGLEEVVVGKGYAGTADVQYFTKENYGIIDFKTCKDVDKWRADPEKIAQIALYHIAVHGGISDHAVGYNVLISRNVDAGRVKAVEYNADTLRKYARLGMIAVEARQLMTGHVPEQKGFDNE